MSEFKIWGVTCTTKKFGGLGVRDVREWNKAAVGKYIWAIAAKKDTLFVRWIHSIYLDGREWWEYELSNDTCWVWRKLVQLKNKFKEKVSQGVFVKELYSIKRGHKILFGQQQLIKENWDAIVWERMSIPKHRVIMWLAMLGNLRTKEKLFNIGLVADKNCLLCDEGEETISHLFFECTYSKLCLEEIKGWMGIQCRKITLEMLLRWIQKSRVNLVKKRVLYAVISALVYHIWRIKNEVLWDAKIEQVRNTVQSIKREMRLRLGIVKPRKIPSPVKDWFESLCDREM